ncbi:EAL domain-containing protein [Sulfurimonas paralvinellae]|uniref:EAL domain-containing protein n=1 Tax=Sulfurimonas paralvinellae TaxID=317658 RepID=A0A7M1BBD6_9BACT|nr:EAL domain-containing protein [Sulfurimonas paralvinellae]QOP46102.1 EAL domain-containing protein [Sulfurimonas paralvinellae]
MIATYKNYFNDLSQLNKLEFDSKKLREISIIIVPMLIGPISFVWALIYLIYGQYTAASVPILYSFISLFNLWHYKRTNNLLAVQKTQMFLVLILPFVLMWILGGFANSSYVMVWAFFAPIAAIIHEKRGEAKFWLLSFLGLMAFSVFIDPWLIAHNEHLMPKSAQEIFFFLNISASLTGIYYLLKFFVYNKNRNINAKLKAKNEQLLEYTKELQTMLYTDSLTQLKNRAALVKKKNEKEGASLILINIDRFSQVNDLFGENFGNKVLIAFSALLQKMLQSHQSCELYRLSGDEFVILSYEQDTQKLTKNIKQLIGYINEHPLEIDEQEISLNITVGISREDASQLLPTANMAIKSARRSKRNLAFYTQKLSLNDEYENNIHWIKEMRDAIKEDRILPYFQPIMDNETHTIYKYETLLRLIDRNGNAIAPDNFLEIAKKSKLYKQLTRIVIEKSFAAFKDTDYDFSINLTIDDILDKKITAMIFETLEHYDISKRVIFEIVESESIENFDKVEAFINKVKSYGCRISIDDFGTGYSNFEHLMKLQADYIKIDGSIISEIVHNKRSELITSVIVAFAKEMQIETIGEYVETKEIHDKLITLGVNKSQGYYFDRPQPDLP